MKADKYYKFFKPGTLVKYPGKSEEKSEEGCRAASILLTDQNNHGVVIMHETPFIFLKLIITQGQSDKTGEPVWIFEEKYLHKTEILSRWWSSNNPKNSGFRILEEVKFANKE